MTPIILDTPITIVPAQEAVTANSFVVTYIEENYGYNSEDENQTFSGRRIKGRGFPSAVIADVEIGTAPGPVVNRTLTVWEGEEYLAVRGTWTDADLYAKIKQLLESSN